jgi:hypothetical protein
MFWAARWQHHLQSHPISLNHQIFPFVPHPTLDWLVNAHINRLTQILASCRDATVLNNGAKRVNCQDTNIFYHNKNTSFDHSTSTIRVVKQIAMTMTISNVFTFPLYLRKLVSQNYLRADVIIFAQKFMTIAIMTKSLTTPITRPWWSCYLLHCSAFWWWRLYCNMWYHTIP